MTARELIADRLPYLEMYTDFSSNYTREHIILLMKEYAKEKCLEAIRNTRYKAIEVINKHTVSNELTGEYKCNAAHACRDIQNIKNEDILSNI